MSKTFKRYRQRQEGQKPLPPLEELRDLFDYDKERGLLLWKNVPKNPHKVNGDAAGTVVRRARCKPTLAVSVRGKLYKVPRLVWKMCTGQDPGQMRVCHVDGDVFNNRIENLVLRPWSGGKMSW